ncbi:hypothetical protein CcI49_17370 [Frankia sp. CcI49]|nr:hypothetical protein CcI49_17370 [Frankia sp. CcI49]
MICWRQDLPEISCRGGSGEGVGVNVETRALHEARIRGWSTAAGPHLVLALLSEPSVATEVLAEHGVTYDRVAGDGQWGALVTPRTDGAVAPPDRAAPGMTPDAYKVCGRAAGLALAAGFPRPRPEDWLSALVYSGDGMGFAAVLQSLEVSVLDVVASMRRRGLDLPPVEVAPFTRPRVTRRPRP